MEKQQLWNFKDIKAKGASEFPSVFLHWELCHICIDQMKRNL